eukprot:10910930-Alexandrium_andersonii.AAC.1
MLLGAMGSKLSPAIAKARGAVVEGPGLDAVGEPPVEEAGDDVVAAPSIAADIAGSEFAPKEVFAGEALWLPLL